MDSCPFCQRRLVWSKVRRRYVCVWCDYVDDKAAEPTRQLNLDRFGIEAGMWL